VIVGYIRIDGKTRLVEILIGEQRLGVTATAMRFVIGILTCTCESRTGGRWP